MLALLVRRRHDELDPRRRDHLAVASKHSRATHDGHDEGRRPPPLTRRRNHRLFRDGRGLPTVVADTGAHVKDWRVPVALDGALLLLLAERRRFRGRGSGEPTSTLNPRARGIRGVLFCGGAEPKLVDDAGLKRSQAGQIPTRAPVIKVSHRTSDPYRTSDPHPISDPEPDAGSDHPFVREENARYG
ncbi:hypothetical protein M885DRAFT_544543, partial [Pelagophyceae sp. CCMP2097]